MSPRCRSGNLDSKGAPPQDVSGENQDILPLKREFSQGSSTRSVPLPYEVSGDDDPLPELDIQGVGVGGATVKVCGKVTDLTNAFGQSRKTSRKNKLATTLPQGVTHAFGGTRQLLLVGTEIYGLVSGPS